MQVMLYIRKPAAHLRAVSRQVEIIEREGNCRMKVLLLCDRESSNVNGCNLRELVQIALQSITSETRTVVLNSDEIHPCIGCFGCWIKTPGLCVIKTDCANSVSGLEIQSDAVVLLSRVTFGGYSADIKAFLDRSIPNISPFLEIYRGEMHHKVRYSRFPRWIAFGYGESTPRERQTFSELAERNALNMRPPKYDVFTACTTDEIFAAIQALTKSLSEEVRS